MKYNRENYMNKLARNTEGAKQNTMRRQNSENSPKWNEIQNRENYINKMLWLHCITQLNKTRAAGSRIAKLDMRAAFSQQNIPERKGVLKTSNTLKHTKNKILKHKTITNKNKTHPASHVAEERRDHNAEVTGSKSSNLTSSASASTPP